MGFAVFVLGSLACALSWNEVSIIAFRIVQGVVGAFIMANSGAAIAHVYPRERGGVPTASPMGWTVGAVVGIVLGSLIATYVSWRCVSRINVPVGWRRWWSPSACCRIEPSGRAARTCSA